MKMKLLLAMAVIALSGCKGEPNTAPVYTAINGVGISVYVIDSCEYIGYIAYGNEGSTANYLSHKGNCKYCAARLTAPTHGK